MTIDLAALREAYLRAQLARDSKEAVRLVLDGLARGASVKQLQSEVVASAQLEIGRLWQLNAVTVAQEHAATAISQLVLSALYEHAIASPSIEKKIVLACVQGEHHDLPPRMLADALQLEGFAVRFLGGDVKHEALLAVVEQEAPDAIGLSVTMTFNLPALRVIVPRLRAITRAPILVGGHALDRSSGLATELAVTRAGESLEETLATVRRATGLA